MSKRKGRILPAVAVIVCFLSAGCEKAVETAETIEKTEPEKELTEKKEPVKESESAKETEPAKEPEETGTSQTARYDFREAPLVIELDAGHGKSGGAENAGHGALEREINLQIALALKEELEAYENVTVYLTRDDAFDVELEDRVRKAVQDKADVLISLHNNATGSICDYYSIVRNSVKAGIPGIIVEHAFLDNEEDYQAFFADLEKIRRLAVADAKGIAGYYHLKKKGSDEISLVLENHREKVTLIVSDDYQDNTYFEKMYFHKDR